MYVPLVPGPTLWFCELCKCKVVLSFPNIIVAAFSRVFMSETGLIVAASEMVLVYFIRSVIEALRLVDLKFLILPSTLDILPSTLDLQQLPRLYRTIYQYLLKDFRPDW